MEEYKEELKDIGNKIKSRKQSRGWSDTELAKRTGYSPSYISYLLRGERAANIKVYIDIANAFGIKLETLFRK